MNDRDNQKKLSPAALWSCPERSLAGDRLMKLTYPWEALSHIGEWICEIGAGLDPEVYEQLSETVWIARDVSVAPTATIIGPCVIGPGTEVRPGAFIRGNALVGAGCVVGNSTELKNCILFDKVQVPHFNYVGDSVLGLGSHMGAGAVTSNVKSDKTPVTVKGEDISLPTERKKVGAFLGDYVEVGCHCVLNPGTVIGAHSNVYPLTSVRGYVPGESLLKGERGVFPKENR